MHKSRLHILRFEYGPWAHGPGREPGPLDQAGINPATVPATVPTLSATAPTVPTVPATTGGSKSNEEFKEDPLDYVFEKYMDNLKELSKYWGIKYNKNEKKTLKLLKIALKCKNNMKITSKEMKILAKNIGLSKTKTNIETLKEKLQNVPIIN